MKKVTITLTLVAVLLTGCKSNKVALEHLCADVSWSAFCFGWGYDINDNTYQATNEYLDTWCGSVDEEEAFINAGVEHY